MTFTVGIIPTYNRPEVCRQAVAHLTDQVDALFVIDDGDEKPMPFDTEHAWQHWIVVPSDQAGPNPSNLSKIWNQGIDLATKEASGVDEFDIVIINDDAMVPPGWVETVSANMRNFQAAAGCSGHHDVILRAPGPVPLSMRMQGWAFMLRGEVGLRVDERFEWWFGDSDLDWQARQAGGMAMVRGYPVPNLYADQSTNGLRAEQAARDGERFNNKWGGLKPW